MGGQQRIYKQRIASTMTLAKVFRAMEMIAASRIGAARRAATEAGPYEKALTQAVAAVAIHTDLDHPLTRERADTTRVAVLVVASDRGMAGAYAATILRESEKLIADLESGGYEPVIYTFGRRAAAYFRFRSVPIERAWEGESDAPTIETTREVAAELLGRFLDKDPASGVGSVHLVYTRFNNVMSQVPEVRQMLPLSVVDSPHADQEREAERGFHDDPAASFPEYEFIGAGLPPARHAHGHGQRRRTHHEVHAPGELGPPGGNHPGDHGDRGRGRRIERGLSPFRHGEQP